MWFHDLCLYRGNSKFFRLIVSSHEKLSDFYKTNFILLHDYHYSLTELENMLPWERDILLGMISQRVDDIKQKQQAQQK
jgi:hypothetical protein